jgi:hypothetical protein
MTGYQVRQGIRPCNNRFRDTSRERLFMRGFIYRVNPPVVGLRV